MPSLDTATQAILASMQARFVTSAATPAVWQLNVGEEVVADLDAFTDTCCQGMGVVLITNGALEVGTVRGGAGMYMRITVALTVLRCAPTVDDAGRSPTEAEHQAYTSQVLDDVERMLATVKDVAQYEWVTEDDISDPEWTAVPVEGGCGGAAVVFEVAVIGAC